MRRAAEHAINKVAKMTSNILMQDWMICHKDALSIYFVQRKFTMLYGSKVVSLIYIMVYKPLGKFESSIFWSQDFRSLDLKPLNGLQLFKEGLIWALEKVIQHKLV